MKYVAWDSEKNDWLKTERNVSFEDALNALLEGDVIGAFPHPNQKRYPSQRVFVIVMRDYIYVMPFIEDDEKIFLKTIFPSRKYTRDYIEKGGV